MTPDTLLDVFTPPEGMVGHSAALVAMTGNKDFLDEVVQRFTGLGHRQRAEMGRAFVYAMLDGHASSSRAAIFAPGEIPGLHEFHARAKPGSLVHAKVALLAFGTGRMGSAAHLRLAVLTGNLTYASVREQLELAWVADVPLHGASSPEDRADVKVAGEFLARLLSDRYYRDEGSLPTRQRALTGRLDVLLSETAKLTTNRKPRFIHSLNRPLYEQIKQRFRRSTARRNLLLCGSGFYETPSSEPRMPVILEKLQALGVFTSTPRRVAIVEPREAGAVAGWVRNGDTAGWEVVKPHDAQGHNRCLHAKFIYAGHLRDGCVSNGCLYLGSGNLSKRGLLSHGGMEHGNVECGVVFSVPERLSAKELAERLFWDQDQDDSGVNDGWGEGQVGNASEEYPFLSVPPILSASVRESPRRLRLHWRDDGTGSRASIRWLGHDWLDVEGLEDVALPDNELPSALEVRDGTGQHWRVPVVDPSGRTGSAVRFDTYHDALQALLDFPARPAEDADDEDEEGGGDPKPQNHRSTSDILEQEKRYALHAAAEFIEKVAALQATLQHAAIADWLDHLDRMLTAFPATTIAAWRAYRLDVFAHLREPALRPPDLSEGQRARYVEVLDKAARAWGAR